VNNYNLISFAVLIAFAGSIYSNMAAAQERKFSFIRDAEIESIIRTYATPLFQAAGLEPSAIKVFLVKDNSLNAFVAGGQNLFLNTGLLVRAESANQVIGVIAHETGHIASGHLVSRNKAIGGASTKRVIATLLGSVIGVISGRPDIGEAIILGGTSIGQRGLLQFSRTQESQADQAALRLLDRSKQSAVGLLNFMKILQDQDLVSSRFQDPYVRSHPLTRDRINTIAHHVESSPFSKKPTNPELVALQSRIRAKLIAFLEPATLTLRRYPESDTSISARYARAIAEYRKPDIQRALGAINALIAENPSDPYFLELKGQMLFEDGQVEAAIPAYEQSAKLVPHEATIRVSLARAQIESGRDDLLDPAIRNLQAALQREPKVPSTWRQLAIAYGRLGQDVQSSLALAEEALLLGKMSEAEYHARKAEQALPKGSPDWLKSQDILNATLNRKEQSERKN
jgi:predicted Zn-dependent protease